MTDARCIGCGCSEQHACQNTDSTACSWLRVDREAGFGVCSSCPALVDRFDAQERELSSELESQLILPGDDDYDDTLIALRNLQ